jgi:hypothetical protein
MNGTALELALFWPTRCVVYGDVDGRLKRPLVPVRCLRQA